MAEENQPREVTIDEAINHVKSWIQNGDLDKAEKGLTEIIEFAPENKEAKKLLDSIKAKKEGVAQEINVEPQVPEFTMQQNPETPEQNVKPTPEPQKEPEPKEELPGIEKVSDEELSSTLPEEKQKSSKTLLMVIAGVILLAALCVGGYFAYQNFVVNTEETVASEEPKLSEEQVTDALFKEEEPKSTEVVTEMEEFVEIFEEPKAEEKAGEQAEKPAQEKVKVKPIPEE